MRKFSGITLLFMFILAVSLTAFAEEQTAFTIAPVSPQFQEWLNSRNIKKLKNNSSDSSVQTERKFPTGCIPSPIDRSNLWKNPPRPKINLHRTATLPAYYDLREQNRVTSVKNQNPYGTCWAFASLGSLESTYKKSYSSENPDLSEMFLAYFVFGDTRAGKSFEYRDTAKDILDQSGNADISIALISRLGTVEESVVPYSELPSKLPEEYETSKIYLKEAYQLGSIINSAEMRNVVKELVMNYGGVSVGYYMNDGPVHKNGKWAYFDNNHNEGAHWVLIAGWDDNFSRDNFSFFNKPSSDGAWLIKNSWGSDWADNGYFWTSYEQNTHGLALFIAGKTDEKLKQYGYDDLGMTATIGRGAFWGANIFKAESEDETLKHVGFYTVDNNESYTIYIYDLGTSKPSSPVNGTLLGSVDGYKSYVGYHTEDFNITLTKGHYFSVVMKADTSQAIEKRIQGYAEPVVNSEESYCSEDGESWTDVGKDYGINACLKAFTVGGTSAPVSGVKIDAEHFPDDVFRKYVQLYDHNDDGILSNEEATRVKTLYLYERGISSLKGIEYFTALTYLNCNHNQLTAIDVSKNTALTELYCYYNRLTALDVRGCTALTRLECYNNQLTTLDVSNCTALTELSCATNKLTTLDFSKNIALTSLNCNYNQLTALDVSKNTTLTALLCEDNQLTTLNVSKNTALTYLDCGSNQLTTLDVSKNTALTYLNCIHNELTTLDVSKNAALTRLDCYYNQLTTLDVSKNTALRDLWCGNNRLTTLDVSNCSKNIYVNCDSSVTVIREKNQLQISTQTITNAIRGKSYTFTLKGKGGTAPYTWSISKGSLPNGLSLAKSTGKITGTPTKAGTFKFTVQVKDNKGKTAVRELSIKVTQATISAKLKEGVRKAAYSVTLKASGGTSPYTWAISKGALPDGLTLNKSTGKITGTPTKAGTFSFTVKITDKNKVVATKAFTLKVTQTTLTASIPSKIVRGQSYTWKPEATGGTSAYKWTISKGSLPTGMNIKGGNV